MAQRAELFTTEQTAPPRESSRKYIDYLTHALTDPLIVWPSAWAADISAPSLQWARDLVPLQRLALLIRREYETATDVEVMLYMMPRTLEAPLDHDWTQIYLHCSTQALRFAGKDVPDDIAVDALTDWQTEQLSHFKHWLYERRVKANRQPKRRKPKAEARQPDQLQIEQMAFEF